MEQNPVSGMTAPHHFSMIPEAISVFIRPESVIGIHQIRHGCVPHGPSYIGPVQPPCILFILLQSQGRMPCLNIVLILLFPYADTALKVIHPYSRRSLLIHRPDSSVPDRTDTFGEFFRHTAGQPYEIQILVPL